MFRTSTNLTKLSLAGLDAERGQNCFPREEHLKQRKCIRQVMKKGVRFSVRGAKLFVLANGLQHNRIAFTFARKFGIAAERNRARRLGREAWRRLRKSIASSYDFVLLVYPDAKDTEKCQERLFQLGLLLKKAEVFK